MSYQQNHGHPLIVDDWVLVLFSAFRWNISIERQIICVSEKKSEQYFYVTFWYFVENIVDFVRHKLIFYKINAAEIQFIFNKLHIQDLKLWHSQWVFIRRLEVIRRHAVGFLMKTSSKRQVRIRHYTNNPYRVGTIQNQPLTREGKSIKKKPSYLIQQ